MTPGDIDSRTTGENERRVLRRDPHPHLFRPLMLRSVTLKNRIVLSPMCQYSAAEGLPDRWHLIHLGARAAGGAGLIFTEAVHVEPRGRITPYCLGLWNDEQAAKLAEICDAVSSMGAVAGIQLGHAGRKASVGRPWEGTRPIPAGHGGWDVIGPSAVPYASGWPVPAEMCGDEIRRVLMAFKSAARRAREAGFKVLELHCGHGYLQHQFLSALSNRRKDEYGGTLGARCRLLLETIDHVRSEWPAELPLFVRLSVTDWVEGGITVDDSVVLAQMLRSRGDVDLLDCSSGGNDPRQKIPIHPGYQVPLAATLRQSTGLKTAAVGLIHSPDLAESVLANGFADLVCLGRALLADPMWPIKAAKALRAAVVPWPVQYERSDIF
jgi:2,4-dienoyl-CoA reductase-like NADH-dependent reductase (Old Yellow Enzyme family)